MEGYYPDVQALLDEIDGHHEAREDGRQAPSPYSTADPSRLRYSSDYLQGSRQSSSIRHQQPRHERHAFAQPAHFGNPEDDAFMTDYGKQIYTGHAVEPLLERDGALPGGIPGRRSLPGYTGPYSQSPFFNQLPRQQPNPTSIGPSPQGFMATTGQYARTPPAQRAASPSPVHAPPSSPSLATTQYRTRQNTFPRALAADSVSHKKASESQRPPMPGYRTQRQPPNSDISHDSKGGYLTSESTPPPCLPQITSKIDLKHAPPIVQGVRLVCTNDLPDRIRSVFPFQLFNAIQSKCYRTAFQSNENLVVSAPTGGGKTAILELAICRLVTTFQTDQYKVVYMAPTKALCSERQRDWQSKFSALGLQSAELTGDTDNAHLRSVQSANIVITTPEKWDSMTRKWKDHARLMQTVKLFLIDEVHILKDARGATLEAVVSRMKSVGSNVRFVALSATVPNSEDIAAWLGLDPTNQHLAARRENFGEDFRPVRLQKHVVGLPYRGSDFGFESACNPKLPAIIAKYSHKKPIMIFCITRKSTVVTAKFLAKDWATKTARDRYWEGPSQRIVTGDADLRSTLSSGVAFHHAGLNPRDRQAVEKGFLEGQINVICCTSTLAVGVNLPCHFVIIKNTVTYHDEGLQEYADLEVMQMLGRAGRPQFDDSAVAVIITKQEKVRKYEALVSGEELLESCLHLNLIDHLNAEIGLGTIYDLDTAKRWLASTFLFVRLGKNPAHYKLDGDMPGLSLDDRVERICKRDLGLLEEKNLITSNDKLKATEFGDAMARYYVRFQTMQVLLNLGPRSKTSEILSALVQADEYREIRLRANEKRLFKEINSANSIKFPIKVDIAMHTHKRSLIIQSELGVVEFPPDEQYVKYKNQFQQDKNHIFTCINRLIRCVIDCKLYLQDAVAVRNGLELARSLSARVWDNSPFQMKQIPQIGLVAIRKLSIAGIDSIDALDATEPHRIEMILSRNPPFGHKILSSLKDFPMLRVSLKMMGKEIKKGRPVVIKIKANCGFLNEKPPIFYQRKPVYVCLLTERSDGYLIDFRLLSAKKLEREHDILISAELLSPSQWVTCYIMCDEIAGTTRYAELKPELPTPLFPPSSRYQDHYTPPNALATRGSVDMQLKSKDQLSSETLPDDEFGGDDFDDQEMIDAAAGMGFTHIEDFETNSKQSNTAPGGTTSKKATNEQQIAWSPKRLENGKWECKHACKDKTTCKHFCCREGLDKQPKAPKIVSAPLSSQATLPSMSMKRSKMPSIEPKVQSKLNPSISHASSTIERVDLSDNSKVDEHFKRAPRENHSLERLHRNTTHGFSAPSLRLSHSIDLDKVERLQSSILQNADTKRPGDEVSTDYSDGWASDLPSPSVLIGKKTISGGRALNDAGDRANGPSSPVLIDTQSPLEDEINQHESLEKFESDDEAGSELEAAMIGLSDSVIMDDKRSQDREEGNLSHSDEYAALPEESLGILRPTSTPIDVSRGNPSVPGVEIESQRPSHVTERLEKGASGQEKRIRSELDEDSQQTPPAPKRCKMGEGSTTAPRPSSSGDNPGQELGSIIRPGLPAWVYEFDPALIAEFQDHVEFV